MTCPHENRVASVNRLRICRIMLAAADQRLLAEFYRPSVGAVRTDSELG